MGTNATMIVAAITESTDVPVNSPVIRAVA